MAMIFKPGLELSLENGAYKGKTNVTGWKDGRYLLLDIPNGWSVKQNQHIVARLSNGGMYCGFSSEVIGSFPEINVAVVKFPDDISESTSRKNGRFPAAIPVYASRQTSSNGAEKNGIITDISLGGLKFTCHMMFRVAEKVFLNFSLPTGQSVSAATVTVKSMKAGEKKYEYGAEFDIADETVQKAVGKLIERLNHVAVDGTESDQPPMNNQLNVPVEGNLQMQVGMLKLNTVFRGATKKHLIIDAPMMDGKPVIVGRGMAALVRYANAGMAYGFDVEIFKQYTSPAHIWALNHPGIVKGLSLRKSSRMTAFIPAVMQDEEGGKHVGVIVDLSEGGGLFASSSGSIKTDGYCSVSFTLPTGQKIESLSCELKNARRIASKTMIGLCFKDRDADKFKLIKAYYDTCRQHLS
ncbi:MAG: PilZ domain-containing protein [Nitrospinae bacterium]|nr:PilZ domain-containing protein [Nitrospinota bacterium]MBF0634400.1 PilZ domain-containing protein [Nitrospinota bacterium]